MFNFIKNMIVSEEAVEAEVERRVSHVVNGLSLQPRPNPFGTVARPLHRPLLWECGQLSNLIPPAKRAK
jgi:hypothetical protein